MPDPSLDPRPTVLVVDDEAPILDLVRALFKPHAVDCVATTDPAEAARVLDVSPVDLVVCDAHLGGDGAREVLTRAARSGPPIPVVLLVRQRPMGSAGRTLEAEAYDRLRKPFELSRLPAVALRALETRRLARENAALRDALAFQRVVQAVRAAVDEREFMRAALDAIGRAVEADRVVLFVREPGRSRLVRSGGTADDGEPLAVLEQRIAARAAAVGSPIVLPGDPAETPPFTSSAHTALGIPLDGQAGMLGVVVALRRYGPGVFQAAHLQRLGFLTHSMAAVMEATLAARRSALGGAEERGPMAVEVDALVVALDARGHEARGHSARVAAYALRLADELGVTGHARDALRHAALFHDLGNLSVPERVLLKAGPLNEDERREIERHPAIGHELLRGITPLAGAAEIVLCHHERWDGSGYPAGLAGPIIPLGARILAVADTLEAMTQERPYRRALAHADVIDELTRRRATRFDPQVVAALVAIPEPEWTAIRDRSTATAAPSLPEIPAPLPVAVPLRSISG